MFLVGHAVGVQIYSCNATTSGHSWGLVAPRANLYGDKGKLLMTHFAGPTWRAKDGSRVVAQRVDGVTVDATAIPWLLLSTVSTAPGPDGDRLTKTTFIQRIATTGGLAPPAAECNAGTVGAVREIPYTADYYFWKARRTASERETPADCMSVGAANAAPTAVSEPSSGVTGRAPSRDPRRPRRFRRRFAQGSSRASLRRRQSSSSTSRSLRAKASGWPAYPNSPPRKPPWWEGNTVAC